MTDHTVVLEYRGPCSRLTVYIFRTRKDALRYVGHIYWDRPLALYRRAVCYDAGERVTYHLFPFVLRNNCGVPGLLCKIN